MASDKSHEMTISNNKSEKEEIDFFIFEDPKFLNPDAESSKVIMALLRLDPKSKRVFDLIIS